MSREAAPAPSAPRTIVLPKRLRAAEVASLLDEIRRRDGDGALILDFREVEDFDGATLALLGHVAQDLPGVTAVRVPEAMVRAGEGFSKSPSGLWPAKPVAPRTGTRSGRFLRGLADHVLNRARVTVEFLSMMADEVYHVGVYLKTRQGVYPGEIGNQMFFMGYQSYPIVCVLLFLVGVTISFAASGPLQDFGASTYIADIIGYAMLRELVPLMAGVILAGKVGAAITAELASMSVLEEVDALKTMGVIPERFLMVPRLAAITAVVPLLVAMADVCGIAGGMTVSGIKYGTLPKEFLDQMVNTVDWTDFAWGLIKTVVFGWAIVISAGFKGLTVGRSAEEVGRATTESVVLSITLVIVLDCLFAFVLY
jgi:phospholipid/cholesterol/gamma-HCH transport system permease protein